MKLPGWLSGKESACQYRGRYRFDSWVWEDPTCHRATKPMRHNYWACALAPRNHNCWAHTSQLLKPTCPRARALQQERPLQLEDSPCSLQREESPRCNKDSVWPKISYILKSHKAYDNMKNRIHNRKHTVFVTKQSMCVWKTKCTCAYCYDKVMEWLYSRWIFKF